MDHPPPSILIVDDESAVRRVLRTILEARGFVVFEADNGKAAVDHPHSQFVDLLLTDLVMPDREGIETIMIFRRSYPSKKIIAMSGAFGGAYLDIARALGAHETLSKPVRPNELIDAVERVLQSSTDRSSLPLTDS